MISRPKNDLNGASGSNAYFTYPGRNKLDHMLQLNNKRTH